MAADEVIGEGPDVVPTIAQGRHGDLHDVEPVVEVFPEGPGRHRLLEIGIGGGDDPQVELHAVGAAHALDLPLLEHAEKLGLHLRAERADLVQEERSALGQLEATELALVRARERAALVAEELGLR